MNVHASTQMYVYITTCLQSLSSWYPRLCVAFKKFSQFHANINFSPDTNVNTLQRICLPVTDVLLSKNVTTCRRHGTLYIIVMSLWL